MLDSVSLIDAAMFGVPLITYAFLGKDGGNEAMQGVYSMFESVTSKFIRKLRDVGKDAIKAFLETINADAVAKAGISKVTNTISSIFDSAKSAFSDFKSGNRSFGDIFKGAIEGLKASNFGQKVAGLFDFSLSVGNASKKTLSGVRDFSTSAMQRVGAAAKGMTSVAGEGLATVLSMLRNPWVIGALLTVGIAGIANAASGATSAIGSFTSELTTLLGVTAAIAASLVVIGTLGNSVAKALEVRSQLKDAAKKEADTQLLPSVRKRLRQEKEERQLRFQGFSADRRPDMDAELADFDAKQLGVSLHLPWPQPNLSMRFSEASWRNLNSKN